MITDELRARRALGGRIGSAIQRSRNDPRVYTVAAREAFQKRFMPSDPTLSEKEVHLRAAAARRAYMLQLSLKSAQVRAKRMAGRNGGNGRKTRADD